MAYTWVKVDKFDIDDEWNSLYEDSKEDLNQQGLRGSANAG